MLILTRDDVASLLDPLALIDAVSAGFQGLSAGAFEAPPRQAVGGDGGSVLTMAGRGAGGPVAVKLVGVFPGNVGLGLEPHPAVICLLDASTGVCLALMDGEEITGLRTAAGAASPRARSRAKTRPCSPSSAQACRPARTCACFRWCATSPRCASSPATRRAAERLVAEYSRAAALTRGPPPRAPT